MSSLPSTTSAACLTSDSATSSSSIGLAACRVGRMLVQPGLPAACELKLAVLPDSAPFCMHRCYCQTMQCGANAEMIPCVSAVYATEDRLAHEAGYARPSACTHAVMLMITSRGTWELHGVKPQPIVLKKSCKLRPMHRPLHASDGPDHTGSKLCCQLDSIFLHRADICWLVSSDACGWR